MRGFFHNKVVITAFLLIAAVLVSSAVITLFFDGDSVVHKAAGAVVSPFQKLFTGIKNGISDIWAAQTKYDELLAENEELKNKILELQDTVRDAQVYKSENDDLRRLLDMRLNNTELTLETATVIARSDIGWASVYTINKGTKDGIYAGCAVITADGLVGTVTSAETAYSEVSSLIDTTSSFSALLTRAQLIVSAGGDFRLMQTGHLRLSSVPLGSDVKIGDDVVTAGLGGNLPPQLLVGTVTEVGTEPDGMTSFAVVKPAASLDELRQVFVVLDFVTD